MARDWGLDSDPMPSGWPSKAMLAHELPEVVGARDEGWFLAPDAPMWAFLPAVWPPEHRRWLEDRSIRWTRISCSGAPSTTVPWSAWGYFEHERDTNDLLTASSVPPRPAGRLWLLRVPEVLRDLDSTMDSLAEGAVQAGIALTCSRDFVEFVEATIEDWFETRQAASPLPTDPSR